MKSRSADRDRHRVQELLRELQLFLRERATHVSPEGSCNSPFGDYIRDRRERAAAMGFGEGASIYDSTLVMSDVKVGRNTWVGSFVALDGPAGLEIGEHCSVSAGVQIYTHHTVVWALSRGQPCASSG